jgi:hypothetical protein
MHRLGQTVLPRERRHHAGSSGAEGDITSRQLYAIANSRPPRGRNAGEEGGFSGPRTRIRPANLLAQTAAPPRYGGACPGARRVRPAS